MPNPILASASQIGKRWPYRFLNFLPPRQVWRFLTWRSGGALPMPPFDLGPALREARRLLLVLPEDPREMLVSIPVIQAYFRALPEAAIWLLAGPRESDFLAGLYGRERLFILDPERFHLGEEHFKELRGRLEGMRPDMVLNLRDSSPPLLHFLLRLSQAPLRIQLGDVPGWPYYNISLAPGEPLNHLRRYRMAARLWDAAGPSMPEKWIRLSPPQEAMARAKSLLDSRMLQGASTLLFPWQERFGGGSAQLDLLKTLSRQAAAANPRRTVAVVHVAEGLFASTPPGHVTETYPSLLADSDSTLLALFTGTAATAGLNGPSLLLAGLSDTDVTGYFVEEDAPFDTSGMNPRFRVVPLATDTSPASSPAALS